MPLVSACSISAWSRLRSCPVLLPRVLAARPSGLIDGMISTVILRQHRQDRRVLGRDASWRAIVKHDSRPEASLPCTLQLTA